MNCKFFAVAVFAFSVCASGGAFAADITGAGATFPYPIYAKWAQTYKEKTGIGLNYQSIGSGGGIKQIRAKTVDFGATDAPLKFEELKKDGMIQFPTVMGGVVPVVNLEGIKPGQVKLTGKALADIYLGNIRKWNDAQLAALNPGVKLPAQDITVVHRSDGSGTTFIFTNYLSKISSDWKAKVGNSTSVSWPAPTSTGGKGNEGVASFVQRIKGSIGYVEYAYAKQNRLTHVLLQNRGGRFVEPSAKSFQAAAAGADWKKAPGFYEILTDEPGNESWPITGATFILMYKVQADPERARAILQFFDWAYREGDQMALSLDYIPMPDSVVKLIHDEWRSQLKDASGKPLWK
ncbi:MAG: phosphate ABC transporter substrate-binding protein PstS [Betaproteobacteria bacterium]|nr:phosphate ABC transporter substrate-binding protein PstS [Betaproteobacteria bacterium]MBI3937691.1 phosphate ABC transporter substrate-binding protein PstS [Betaproteobacteria bacterium]